MSELLTEYFKGIKNYFRSFSKAKAYRISKIIGLILLLIIFNIIAIPCFLFYKLGQYSERKKLKQLVDKKTPTYLSGIHTKKESELISISEVELPNKRKNND